MSLLNTIAHPGASQARRFSLKDAGMITVGLVLGVAIGVTATTDRPAAHQTEAVAAVQTGVGLIQDLAPVGTPNRAALGTGYEAPEMFPVFVSSQPYQPPEMWPRVETAASSAASGSLIEDLAPVGTPRTYQPPEMWPEAEE